MLKIILNLNRSENKILNTFQCPCNIIVKFKMILSMTNCLNYHELSTDFKVPLKSKFNITF